MPISENTPIDTSIVRVIATDRDAGDNAIVTYNLESGGDGMFTIDSWTGEISLRANFRAAQKPLYRLVVSAKDRDNLRSDDAIVEIIKDMKMEELEFDAYGGYEFQITEDFGLVDAKIGREVGRTQIAGTNNRIEYAIVYGDPNGNFEIDQHTGMIRTAKLIDHEAMQSYTLSIAARAGFAYGRTVVNISVIDQNDCAPILKEFDEIKLPENAAVGQEVYLSRARDKDSGINSRIMYSLTYNPDDQFRISESTGVLYLNRPIRAEPETILTVEITAKDGGTPALHSKSVLNIRIEDTNNFTPVFDHTSYETSLSESTRVNTRYERFYFIQKC